MAHEHDRGAAVQQGLDGGHRPADAGVVGDVLGVVQGDVEIHAHQRAFALKFEVVQVHVEGVVRMKGQAENKEAMLTNPST